MEEMQRGAKVDFLSFTTRRGISEVCALFSYLKNPLIAQERGLYGYHFSMVSPDGVTVLYSPGRSDVHVQISGRGCDRDLWQIVELVDVSAGDYVSRLDIAVDCIGSGFTCSDIWGYLRRGCFLSVSNSIRQCEGLLSRGGAAERVHELQRRFSGECDRYGQVYELPLKKVARSRQNTGHTIYVGSSSSDRMVRIYDKGAESETGADWLRFETQLRREAANHFFILVRELPRLPYSGNLLEYFEERALGLLNKQIRLIEPGQEKQIEQRNYSSIKLIPFWEKLISKIQPLKLKLPKPHKTIKSALRYVKNCAASLKMLRAVMPDYNEFIHDTVDEAELKPHHLALQDDLAEGYMQTQADQYYGYLSQCAV